MHTIDRETVLAVLNENGFNIRNLKELSGGANHFVFASETEEDNKIIIKFPRIRRTEAAFSEGHKDTLFGGDLSLERESYLFNLIRNAGLPSPKTFGVFPTPKGSCIVVERSPGCNMMDYMEQHNHSLCVFLEIMQSLGSDFSHLHNTTFSSYGNIMENSEISPAGITNFADRYLPINDMLLSKCLMKKGINQNEYHKIKAFFEEKFESYRDRLNISNSRATLVITDMHGGNFFVENNKISGYFDVESAQSAPFEFELYALRFFVFNYYGLDEYKQAEKTFWNSYYGGKQGFPDKETDGLIDFFSACRLLEIFQSYWGHVDGLRDTWGQRIKNILFDYMETSGLDYMKLGEIWRERDKQPLLAINDL